MNFGELPSFACSRHAWFQTPGLGICGANRNTHESISHERWSKNPDVQALVSSLKERRITIFDFFL